MLNLFRAQLYRLVRNRAFWGLLGVCGFVVAVVLVSLGTNYDGREEVGNVPPLPFPGSAYWLDPQDYLGMVGGGHWAALLTCLLTATFFADDFDEGCCRSLAVSSQFRVEYGVSAVALVAFMATCFLTMAFVVAMAAMGLFFPLLGVTWELGRFARWALAVTLIATTYGALTLAAVMALRRRALAVLIGFLLALGQGEVGLLALADFTADAVASFGVALPWASSRVGPGMFVPDPAVRTFSDWAMAFPAGQLGGPLTLGYVPQAADLVPLVLWLAAAMGIGWLLWRRRAL